MMAATTCDTLKPVRAREAQVLTLLLAGRTLAEICEQAHISRTSLWRLRAREDFQRTFDDARKQAFERAVNALHDGAVSFVETLRAVCSDPKSRSGERATAARSGLDSLFRAVELFDLEQRLQKLEQIAGERGR
jgi:hypothetical protein